MKFTSMLPDPRPTSQLIIASMEVMEGQVLTDAMFERPDAELEW